MMIKVHAQDIRGIEEKIAKTCGFDVEDVLRFADDFWYIDENKELFTKAEDGWLPIGFSLKPARYVVSPYGGGRSKIDLLNDAIFFATKREALEYAKLCEEDEVREYYRSKPLYLRKDFFSYRPVEFSELSKDEIEEVRERFKDDALTTDWHVHTLEEFEQEYNVKFKESLLTMDEVCDSLTPDFYDGDGRLIEDKLRFW